MKTLFICCTDYQLINAINIKKNLLQNDNADIVILNNKAGVFELAKRLQTVNLFQNVYVYSEKFYGIHKYFQNSEKKKSFFVATVGSIRNIYVNLFQLIKGKEWGINKRFCKNQKINFSQYNNVFAVQTESFVSEFLDLILSYNKCSNNLLDDGVGCYLSYELNRKHKIDAAYLYEPEMAVYKEQFKNFVKIPKIDTTDEKFIKLLNYIFDFKKIDKIDLINNIIFFDQKTFPMPEYLRNAGIIKKIIFWNSYKKHYQEHLTYKIQIDIFDILANKIKPEKIFVKFHPRSTREYIEKYEKSNVQTFFSGFSPWEVFCCNCKIENNIWIAMYSSALLAYYFTIKNKSNNKYIFLYRILNRENRLNNYSNIERFFVNLKKFHYNEIFLPNNTDELIANINSIKESKK